MFPEEIQVTKYGKDPIYFSKHDSLPKKYEDESRYVFKSHKKSSGGREYRLYDLQEKMYIVKNAVSASRPRMQAIAGNTFYSGLDEHVRMRVVEYLKSEFQKCFPGRRLELKFPIRIVECEFHTLPRYMNWDLDNLWIYHKCFQDAMHEFGLRKDKEGKYIRDGSGFIPEDNIQIITQAPGARFVPVTSEEERKIVYVIEPDTDPRIVNHLMYNRFPVEQEETNAVRGWLLAPISIGKSGDVTVDMDRQTFFANIGPKKLETNKMRCYDRVHHHCIQMNIKEITTTTDMNGSAMRDCLSKQGVKIYILV
jgi:hypothetical protein